MRWEDPDIAIGGWVDDSCIDIGSPKVVWMGKRESSVGDMKILRCHGGT